MGKVVFLLRFYFKADEVGKFEDGMVGWADSDSFLVSRAGV
jgi:hypothetical protein